MKRALIIIATIVVCALVMWMLDARTAVVPVSAMSAESIPSAAPAASEESLEEPMSESPLSRAAPTDESGSADRVGVDHGPRISGRVLDPAGHPVAGAAIFISFSPRVPSPPVVHTDEEGRFVLTQRYDFWQPMTPVGAGQIAPSTGILPITATAFRFAPSAVVEVTIDTPHEIELHLTEPLEVRGMLFGADGLPVVGANLQAKPARFTSRESLAIAARDDGATVPDKWTVDGDQSGETGGIQPHAWTVSDREGNFVLGGLWPGVAYDIVRPEVGRDTYQKPDAGLVLAANVRPGGSNMVLRLPHKVTLDVESISGTVEIRISRAEGPDHFQTARTFVRNSLGGQIAVDDLVPGFEYGFEIIPERGASFARGPIVIGLHDNVLRFEPHPTGALDVLVVDSNGGFVAYADVRVAPDTKFSCRGMRTRTGTEGVAHFEGLEEGTWHVSSVGDSSHSTAEVVQIAAGETASMRLVLPAPSGDDKSRNTTPPVGK